MWRTIWRACLSNGTALSVESMAAQRLDWARRYLGMIPSLSRPSKQTSPDKPQSRDVYKNVACPLVFFCRFECTFPWRLSSLLLSTALDSYRRHMIFLFGRHPVRLRTATSFPFPPFYITRPPTLRGPPTPANNYRTTPSLWSPLLFFRWKQALRKSAAISTSMSFSLDLGEGIHEGRPITQERKPTPKRTSQIHSCVGLCNLTPKGLDIPNCFANGTPRR